MRARETLTKTGYVLLVSAPSLIMLGAAAASRAGSPPPTIDASVVMLFALMQVIAVAIMVARNGEDRLARSGDRQHRGPLR